MSQDVYRELLDVMQKRGGPYAGKDIPEFFAMVEELFTPEEAAVNNAMPKGPFTVESMSEATSWTKEELEEVLEGMANKGLCVALKMGDAQLYISSRFMPGPGLQPSRKRRSSKTKKADA